VPNPLFNDILNSPGSQSIMDGTYTIIQPAIGIDYLLLRTTTSTTGVTLGLRVGSSISPHRTTWRYQGNDVAGAPDAGPVGSFVRVVIGVGGFKLGGKSRSGEGRTLAFSHAARSLFRPSGRRPPLGVRCRRATR
jgi:hypothetical protein